MSITFLTLINLDALSNEAKEDALTLFRLSNMARLFMIVCLLCICELFLCSLFASKWLVKIIPIAQTDLLAKQPT